MLSVDEAKQKILADLVPVDSETVTLNAAHGRVLSADIIAPVDQPPFAISAMDGYAVRSADVAHPPAKLKVIGTAPAGKPFSGTLRAGETVRLFTGSVIPSGADAIVIQEDTTSDGEQVVMSVPAIPGRHIRAAGLDFKAGAVLLKAGHKLAARDLSLVAAADMPRVAVRRKPVVVIAATGDELSLPGEPRKPGGIVASSAFGLSALIAEWGGHPVDLGILPDRAEAFAAIADKARQADLVVTTGGASVGDHDLVQSALTPLGFKLGFWKVAMRPGKPIIFGHLKGTPLIGLPGNPVSAMVGAHLFLRPAVSALLGTSSEWPFLKAKLLEPLKANDSRQDYLRAVLEVRDGEYWVKAQSIQDSSMLSPLSRANCLIVRAPHAEPRARGDYADILQLS